MMQNVVGLNKNVIVGKSIIYVCSIRLCCEFQRTSEEDSLNYTEIVAREINSAADKHEKKGRN